jgi:hypothetical protein
VKSFLPHAFESFQMACGIQFTWEKELCASCMRSFAELFFSFSGLSVSFADVPAGIDLNPKGE